VQRAILILIVVLLGIGTALAIWNRIVWPEIKEIQSGLDELKSDTSDSDAAPGDESDDDSVRGSEGEAGMAGNQGAETGNPGSAHHWHPRQQQGVFGRR